MVCSVDVQSNMVCLAAMMVDRFRFGFGYGFTWRPQVPNSHYICLSDVAGEWSLRFVGAIATKVEPILSMVDEPVRA